MAQNKLETIYREISNLTGKEKKILFSKLITEINLSPDKDKKNSIYDIRGVGKEIWQGIDAQEYVNNERMSWK